MCGQVCMLWRCRFLELSQHISSQSADDAAIAIQLQVCERKYVQPGLHLRGQGHSPSTRFNCCPQVLETKLNVYNIIE